MPLVFLAQFVFGLLSLLILGSSGYLLWSWWDGEAIRALDGTVTIVRDDWRLWTGLALLGWSVLGRFGVLILLARPDRGRKSLPTRAGGRQVALADGQPVYVEELGAPTGQPIVFVHGWGMDSTIWSYARDDLASRFRLTLFDLPGLGRSRPAGADDIRLDAFAVVLKSLVEAQASPPVLVGHSIGGMTIQTLVRNDPDWAARHVAGVVLLNTTHTDPLKTMVLSGLLQALRRPVLVPLLHLTLWLQPLAWLSAWQSYVSGSAHMAQRLGFAGEVTRSQLHHTALLATRNPPGAQARGILAMLRWDATGALSSVRIPLLILGGDSDIVTKLEASRTIAATADAPVLEVVDNANHMGMLERFEIYNEAIARFAETVDGRGAA